MSFVLPATKLPSLSLITTPTPQPAISSKDATSTLILREFPGVSFNQRSRSLQVSRVVPGERQHRELLTVETPQKSLLDESKPEELPPPLDATSLEPPPAFDGTTRLYISYTCPYAQRVWITRNYKGLQDQIKLVPLNLKSRPAWYKEKVYAANKVPALEHNGKVIGESLDLIKYLEANFEGPSLLPQDPAKREFAEELFAYTDTFSRRVRTSFKGDLAKEASPAFDYLENALKKFEDGPFFLGQFSLADIAYIPFIERYHIFLSEVFKYDITAGRPKLAAWIEEWNKIEAYKQTKKIDPKQVVESYKKYLAQ